MQILIDSKKEDILKAIAQNYKKSVSELINDSIDKLIKEYHSKKAQEIAQDIYNRYEEALNAKNKGEKLQSLDELIDEL